MSNFNRDNTEGYTAAELATLNQAYDRVMALQHLAGSSDDDYEMDDATYVDIGKSLADALHNAWTPGLTVDGLVARLDPSWTRGGMMSFPGTEGTHFAGLPIKPDRFRTSDGFVLYRAEDGWVDAPAGECPDLVFDDVDGHPVDDAGERLDGHFLTAPEA